MMTTTSPGFARQTPMLAGRVFAEGPYGWHAESPTLTSRIVAGFDLHRWSRSWTAHMAGDIHDRAMALRAYLRRGLVPPPRPDRPLSEVEAQGKAIFERTTDKFGAPIPETNRCSYCHSGPKGTNQRSFDVGTKKATDNSGLLDTPQLSNIALSAPYLHDGSAASLEEIWTIYNPQDKHGRTNDLTKDELNDLIEYLRTR